YLYWPRVLQLTFSWQGPLPEIQSEIGKFRTSQHLIFLTSEPRNLRTSELRNFRTSDVLNLRTSEVPNFGSLDDRQQRVSDSNVAELALVCCLVIVIEEEC